MAYDPGNTTVKTPKPKVPGAPPGMPVDTAAPVSGLTGIKGFDPFAGSTSGPLLLQAIRAHAARSRANQIRRGQVGAQLAGLDPFQQRQAFTDINQAAGGQQADFINNAQLQQLLGEQAFGRQQEGANADLQRQMQFARFQQQLERQNQPGIGSYLGQLAGMGIGSFLGPLGMSLGGGLGKQLGGSDVFSKG